MISQTPDEKAREDRVEALQFAARRIGLTNRYGDPKDADSTEKPQSIPGICGRCRHSTIYRRPHGDAQVFCSKLSGDIGDPRLVPSDLVWCSEFALSGRPPMRLEDMERLAVLIDVRPGPPGINAYL